MASLPTEDKVREQGLLHAPNVCILGDKHSSVGWPFQDVLHITRCILHPADGCHSYVGWLAFKMCCTSLDAFCIPHMASILMLDGLFKMCCTSLDALCILHMACILMLDGLLSSGLAHH